MIKYSSIVESATKADFDKPLRTSDRQDMGAFSVVGRLNCAFSVVHLPARALCKEAKIIVGIAYALLNSVDGILSGNIEKSLENIGKALCLTATALLVYPLAVVVAELRLVAGAVLHPAIAIKWVPSLERDEYCKMVSREMKEHGARILN